MIEKIVRHLWLILTGLACSLFLHFANNTIIIGRENVPKCKNVLVICNHQSWIDSWPLTYAVFWPWAILRPWLLPWHVPEFKNFYGNPILATISWLSKCAPVTRGKTAFENLLDHANKLKKGTMMVFPEGTRHRGQVQKDRDTICKWNHGPARLACLTRAEILPVAIRGMSDVWPVGKKVPRLFGETIVIAIGQPIHCRQYWQKLGQKTFDPVRDRSTMIQVSETMKKNLQATLEEASEIFYQRQKPRWRI